MPMEGVGGEGVLDDVGGGVGRRQGDSDDETRGDEAEQAEDEELARPPAQEVFEHRDGALTMRALPRDAAVDREGTAEGQEDQDERGDGREGARGEGGDAGLIPQGGEVVDAGKAHNLPPRMFVVGVLFDRRPLDLLRMPPEQPADEWAGRAMSRTLSGGDNLRH